MIDKNYVRITGIRVTGPSPTTDQFAEIDGLTVIDGYSSGHVVYVDHNELSAWTEGAVRVEIGYGEAWWDCSYNQNRPGANVHVIANYVHNNTRAGEGYGVVVYWGGYVEIVGNMFDQNRHAIAGDGTASAGYIALNNIAMDSPAHDQDFDMHGADTSTSHVGGIGGGQVSIVRNTFLRVNDWAFASRGVACATETFVENAVINRSPANSIEWHQPKNSSSSACQLEQHPVPASSRPAHSSYCGGEAKPLSQPPPWFLLGQGQFFQPNPTDRLGVGDFDGDGHDDLFLATGAGWYYSPAGVREWRFLSNHTEHLSDLLFGDFDGDGRTDVVKKTALQWFISWGGLSDWELLNNLDNSTDGIGQYTVGHFVSPQSTDLFHATGRIWLVSAGGKAAFNQINTSGYRIADLRFGDFDGDGKPDVAQGTHFSSGGRSHWKPLPNINVSKAIAPPGHFSAIPNAQIATFQRYKISLASSIDKGLYVGCCDMK